MRGIECFFRIDADLMLLVFETICAVEDQRGHVREACEEIETARLRFTYVEFNYGEAGHKVELLCQLVSRHFVVWHLCPSQHDVCLEDRNEVCGLSGEVESLQVSQLLCLFRRNLSVVCLVVLDGEGV